MWVVFSPHEYTDTQPHQLLLPPLIKYPQEQHSCFENEAMTRVTMLMWPCHPHYQRLMSYQHHYFRLSAPPSEAISCWHLDVWYVVCGNVCAHKNQSGLSIDLAPEHRSQPWPGLPRQPNIQLTSPQALSAQPSLSDQQLGSSPHITILWPIFGWKVKRKVFDRLTASSTVNHNFWAEKFIVSLAQGFRP